MCCTNYRYHDAMKRVRGAKVEKFRLNDGVQMQENDGAGGILDDLMLAAMGGVRVHTDGRVECLTRHYVRASDRSDAATRATVSPAPLRPVASRSGSG